MGERRGLDAGQIVTRADYNTGNPRDYNGAALRTVKLLYLVHYDACDTISSRFCLFTTVRKKMQKPCKHLIFVKADYELSE